MNKEVAAKAKAAIIKEMEAQKINPLLLDTIMAQLAHETGGFKSKLTLKNNLSGIKYSVNGYGKNSGILPPKNEGKTPYAMYDTIDDWAKDHFRIIKRIGAHKATNTKQFAEMLKKGNYYTDTLSNYTRALISWLPQVKGLTPEIKKTIIGTGLIIAIGALSFYFLIYKNK